MKNKLLSLTVSALALSSAFLPAPLKASSLKDETHQSVSAQSSTRVSQDLSFEKLLERPIDRNMGTDRIKIQAQLGQRFKERGGAENLEKARQYFFTGARAGDYPCMMAMGRWAYEQQSYLDAIKWTTLAAQVFYDQQFSRTNISIADNFQLSLHNTSDLQKEKTLFSEALTLLNEMNGLFEADKKNKFKNLPGSNSEKKGLYSYLQTTLKNQSEALKSYPIFFNEYYEPFLTPAQWRQKRIFLLSLCPKPLASLGQIYYHQLEKKQAPTESLIDSMECLYLAKGEEADGAFSALFQTFIDDKNIKNAVACLQHIGEEDPWYIVAHQLYLSNQDSDDKNLFYAILDCCKKSKSGKADDVEIAIYRDHIQGEEGYKKSYDLLIKSNRPDHRLMLSEIVRYGWHGAEPDINGALSILQTLEKDLISAKTDDFLTDERRQTLLSVTYNNIGSILQYYANDSLTPPEKRPDFLNLAIEYYSKSTLDIAKISLSCLLEERGEVEKAIDLLESLQDINIDIDIKIRLLILHHKKKEYSINQTFDKLKKLMNSHDISSDKDNASLLCAMVSFIADHKDAVSRLRYDLERVIENFDEAEKLIQRASFELHAQNYEQAYLYFSKIALSTSTEAQTALSILAKVWDDFPKKDIFEEKNEETSESSDESDEHKEEDEYVTDNHPKDTPFKEPKLSKKEKKEITKNNKERQKHLKSLERYSNLLSQGRIDNSDRTAQASPTPASLTYDFHTDALKDVFNDLRRDNQKFQELLSDIIHQPWATTGSGQPEVLKTLYKGEQGCISRRINHKDRLVYKVVGPNKIKIMSVKGHYE